MKYLCLIYEHEQNWVRTTKGQVDSIMGVYYSFNDDIRESGQTGCLEIRPIPQLS